MHRAAIASLALVLASVTIAFATPESDTWRIVSYSSFLVGAGILVGLLIYRVWFQNSGENIVAEIIGEGDE
jgi:hypothetical protein